jgi:hypothetical protein
MPVTFGSVQVIPAATAPATPSAPPTAAGASGKEAPDPRDLSPALRHLHERAARLRAH